MILNVNVEKYLDRLTDAYAKAMTSKEFYDCLLVSQKAEIYMDILSELKFLRVEDCRKLSDNMLNKLRMLDLEARQLPEES